MGRNRLGADGESLMAPPCGTHRRNSMRTNYSAVVVAAIAYFVLGGLWYGWLFNKSWMTLEQMTIEKVQAMNPVLSYVVSFLLQLLIAYSLAQLCIWRNANTAGRGASVGVLVWIGFIGPITFMTYMFEMRPRTLFAINAFYPLAGLVLMGAILGGWTKKVA
jgi:hypothetical protein